MNAGAIFSQAKRAAERASAAGSSSTELRDNVLVAVVFSVLGAEAIFNEMLLMAQIGLRGYERNATPPEVRRFVSLASELAARSSLMLKYRIAKLAFPGDTYEAEDALIEDFAKLIELRNTPVHAKSDRIYSVGKGKEKIERPPIVAKLQPMGVLACMDGVIGDWIRLISTPAVAKWACNATANIVGDVVRSIPDCDLRQRMDLFCFRFGAFDPIL